jgi:hypothetical protein
MVDKGDWHDYSWGVFWNGNGITEDDKQARSEPELSRVFCISIGEYRIKSFQMDKINLFKPDCRDIQCLQIESIASMCKWRAMDNAIAIATKVLWFGMGMIRQ